MSHNIGAQAPISTRSALVARQSTSHGACVGGTELIRAWKLAQHDDVEVSVHGAEASELPDPRQNMWKYRNAVLA